MFTVERCSPKRGEICSCTHVPAIQCTHIKMVPSLLVRDSSGGRAIFHEFFFLFILYDFFNRLYTDTCISHRLIVYHSSSIHSPRLDVHTMTATGKLIGIWPFN